VTIVQPKTETIASAVEADPADAEWERRGNDRAEERPSTSSGRTVRFDFCHVGGGTNCVVDGDTFYIGGAKVRIAGIDTPETHPPRCSREAQLGDQATQKLQALLNSGAVTITGIDRDRDTYGRLLRNVAVDGQDVGEALIAAGVAREYGRGRRGWC
jgi:endonuclease YncB( thermonuclease family)